VTGHIMIIPTTATNVIVRECAEPPPLKELQEIVGGPIESVPHLTTIWLKDRPWQAVAFCNEEGKVKDLPVNLAATKLWHESVPQMRGRDVLCGPVIVLWGTADFMDAL